MATPKKPVRPAKPTKPVAPAEPTEDAIVDRKLVASWRKIDRKLSALVKEDATRFDTRYELVADALDADKPLYLAGGYRSFEQFCRQYLKEDPRAVRRNVLVARCADPDEIKQYGAAFLERVIQWLIARKKLVVAKGRSPVAFSTVKVPVDFDGKVRLVALPDVTWEQLDAALHTALDAANAVETVAVVRALERAVKGTSLDEITIKFKAGKLSFSGVPLEWLELFGKVVVEGARAHESKRAEKEAREDARDAKGKAPAKKSAKASKGSKKSKR